MIGKALHIPPFFHLCSWLLLVYVIVMPTPQCVENPVCFGHASDWIALLNSKVQIAMHCKVLTDARLDMRVLTFIELHAPRPVCQLQLLSSIKEFMTKKEGGRGRGSILIVGAFMSKIIPSSGNAHPGVALSLES